MDNIKVSVVMPVLNGMPFMKRALSSVLEQTLRNIEIIVVDAGSKDGTIEYIEEQKEYDGRIKLLHSKYKSMGYQYNVGIQNATGEYIGFCESDDYLDSDMLEKLYKVARENETIDFVKSDFFMFIGEDNHEFSFKYKIMFKKFKEFYGKEITIKRMPELLFRDVNIWNGIYRRDFIEKSEIRLNETAGAAFQDAGFIEQVLLSGASGIYITDACYHYRRDNEGSSVYKDTAIYILQELDYMLRYMEKQQAIKEKYGELVLDRLFDFFCQRYGRELYNNIPNDVDKILVELQGKLQAFVNSLPCGNKEHVLSNEMLVYFLEDIHMFSFLCKKQYEHKLKRLARFRNALMKVQAVVIFGSGELGQSYLAMLVRNNYDRKIVFCDNNPNLWGTNILGDYDILSVNDAAQTYADAIFLISNKEYFWEARAQLHRYGIKGGQILEGPVLGSHAAFEMNWDETSIEEKG